MGAEAIVQAIREALMAAFWLALPMLLLGFIVTIVINMIQIATSLQDSSFSAFPRLVAFLAGSILLHPWMLQKAGSYALQVFTNLGRDGQ
jgi:flagellar biosynthetic protein FliQ